MDDPSVQSNRLGSVPWADTLRSTMTALPHDWLHPHWPAPAHVHALCTTRSIGASLPPYDGFNLGDHVGDAPAAVQANRLTLQQVLIATGPHAQAVLLQQVHGTQVCELDRDTPPSTCADACISNTPGVACTIMVAGCLPVLLTNRQGTAVAAAHAGWRGLAGVQGRGILENVSEHFWTLTQSQKALTAIKNDGEGAYKTIAAAPSAAADTLVWLGPCIGPQAFEVGADVHTAFCANDAEAAQHFKESAGGKYHADLAALARRRLRAMGITQVYGNDSSAAWCTVGNPSKFFSHRRDSAALGGSGRFAVCIWRD